MKVALITGSSKGLGFAFAKHLAEQGYVIALHYFKDASEGRKSLEKIRNVQSESELFQANLTRKPECRKLLNDVHRTFGKIDILINNVGNFVYKPVQEWTEDEYHDVINSNLSSVYFMMQEAIMLMDSGHIINIGCVGCDKIIVRENTTPYYIAKFGVVALTRQFSQLTNVKINALMPGVLETAKVFPNEIKDDQIVTLQEMCSLLDKVMQADKSGQLYDISKGWSP